MRQTFSYMQQVDVYFIYAVKNKPFTALIDVKLTESWCE